MKSLWRYLESVGFGEPLDRLSGIVVAAALVDLLASVEMVVNVMLNGPMIGRLFWFAAQSGALVAVVAVLVTRLPRRRP